MDVIVFLLTFEMHDSINNCMQLKSGDFYINIRILPYAIKMILHMKR